MSGEKVTIASLQAEGFTVIRYHAPPPRCGVHHGWIVEERESGALVVQLIGESQAREIDGKELQFVTRIEAPAA